MAQLIIGWQKWQQTANNANSTKNNDCAQSIIFVVPPQCVRKALSVVLMVLAVLTTALALALALVLLLANSADRANPTVLKVNKL